MSTRKNFAEHLFDNIKYKLTFSFCQVLVTRRKILPKSARARRQLKQSSHRLPTPQRECKQSAPREPKRRALWRFLRGMPPYSLPPRIKKTCRMVPTKKSLPCSTPRIKKDVLHSSAKCATVQYSQVAILQRFLLMKSSQRSAPGAVL